MALGMVHCVHQTVEGYATSKYRHDNNNMFH
jgi:hypothetical protein